MLIARPKYRREAMLYHHAACRVFVVIHWSDVNCQQLFECSGQLWVSDQIKRGFPCVTPVLSVANCFYSLNLKSNTVILYAPRFLIPYLVYLRIVP